MPELSGVRRGLPGRAPWLGGLAPYARVRDCRFVDGVLESLALNERRPTRAAPLCDARLATVRQLSLREDGAGPALWAGGALKTLARVSAPLSALTALGQVGAPAGLERVRVEVGRDGLRAASRGNAPPPAQELLLALDPHQAAAGRGLSLTEGLAGAAWAPAEALAGASRYAALGIEVPDATFEGIASWLRRAAERDEALYVVQGGARVWLDARAGLLRISPHAAGREFERRVVLLAMLLRALREVRLGRVELQGPHGMEAQRYARRVIGPELRRRADVGSLALGSATVLP